MNVSSPKSWAIGLACLLSAASSPAQEAGPDGPQTAERPRISEFLEMTRMILARGANMGPTDGWFHPAEGRYGWAWLAAMMDRNSNGRVSRDEWDTFFEMATRGKAARTIDDLSEALYEPTPGPPPAGKSGAPSENGPSRWTLLFALLKGELGSPFEGPRMGDPAPDFTLKTHDGKSEITLSDFRGAMPVVLIFGSFT